MPQREFGNGGAALHGFPANGGIGDNGAAPAQRVQASPSERQNRWVVRSEASSFMNEVVTLQALSAFLGRFNATVEVQGGGMRQSHHARLEQATEEFQVALRYLRLVRDCGHGEVFASAYHMRRRRVALCCGQGDQIQVSHNLAFATLAAGKGLTRP
jgi:hypothetical protein